MEGEEVFAGRYRSDEEITSWELRDPLVTFGQRLIGAGVVDREALEQVRDAERDRAEAALAFAVDSPPPDLSELTQHQWAEVS
jgi:pyruvate dehydrogenase E1 component alpha subunit